MVSRYPAYASLAARMVSFNRFEWSRSLALAETLAFHGFFYVGVRDSVRCFECGVNIEKWLVDDDVAVEHFRHSPTCPASFKALQVPEQMKLLLKEMLKKMKELNTEVTGLKRWGRTDFDFVGL